MIKLVLSDLDGTLLVPGEYTVREESVDAIHELQAAGVRFAVSSGRDLRDALHIMRGDAACVENLVGSNGQQLYIDGAVVEERAISRASVDAILAVLDRWDTAALMVNTDRRYLLSCSEATHDVLHFVFHDDLTPLDAPIWDSFLKIGLPLNDTDENRFRLIAQLEAAAPELKFVECMPSWYDIMPQGTSKATAIRRMLDELGLAPEEVVVFGDSANDIEMFDLVPNSVAVANATPEAAARARFHIGPVQDNSVAAALREIARRAREQA